ncbi:ribonuclease H-like domain-containing protein, partial [Tanacetum coccineum]
KIVSQLAILGENISQEDLNLKFLRSLPSEWNTHVVVWRNKPDLDTMSFDDLYNNFKIVEQEVKGTASSSSSSSSQNLAFMSSTSSTNKVNTAYGVSTANTQVSTASTQVSTANLSDDTVYAFFGQSRNQDSSRRTINVEEISSKAMLAINRVGFDWSFVADEEVPRDMALMAFSDSEVHNNKTCSKTCLKSFKTLKTQLDDLRIEFNKSEFNLATYKRGLASVEEQLVFYKKNEVLFYEQLAILKRDISYKDSEISVFKSELEKLKQEKENNQLKIENFDNASKSLDKLIGIQIPDKSRKGLGFVSYNVVPPPPTRLFSPPNLDLSNSGLEEFQQPEFEGYGPKTSKSVSEDTSNEVRESPDASLVEELVSNDKLEKKTVFPTVAKINFVRPQQQEKPVRKPVKYAEMYRSITPRGNQRNWNNQKSQQLGSDFVMYNKACFVCGSFNHVQANCNYHQRERMVSGNNYTRVNYNYSAKKAHPSAHRNIVPRAVLMKTGLRPLNTARLVNTAHPKTTVYSARPMSCFSKSAQSTVKRPYSIKTALTNKNYSQKVNTAKGSFYTARPKVVNTTRPNSAVVNALKVNQVNAIKASAYWVWRPTKLNSASITFKRHNFVDAPRGRSRGTCPKSLKLQGIDGDMLPLGEEPKEGKFLMCDKKNSVLFTDTRCFLLSPDFKLADESHVLLNTDQTLPKRTRRKCLYKEYCFLKKSLTLSCAKATLEESIYGKRLGKANTKLLLNEKEKILSELFTEDIADLHGFLSSNSGKRVASKDCITEIENLVDKKVKIIRCDNGTEFKKEQMTDSKLPTTFWAEAVNTACYVQNKISLQRKLDNEDEPQPSSDAGKKDDEGSGVQTRRMIKTTNKQGFISAVYEGKTHEDKKVIQALTDPSWIEAMQDELLQFKLQKNPRRSIGLLVELPPAIGHCDKWVYRNKKEDREGNGRTRVTLTKFYTVEKAIICLHQAPRPGMKTNGNPYIEMILEKDNRQEFVPYKKVKAPTHGAAIVAVDLGDNFTVKGNHISMIKDRQFDGRSRTDPHKHIAEFVKVCGMFRYSNTNADAIKLKLFPSSLVGEAKIWFKELSPGVIATWEEMRQAFVIRFFPPAMFDRLIGEIRGFTQQHHESLVDAWLRMKDLHEIVIGHVLVGNHNPNLLPQTR